MPWMCRQRGGRGRGHPPRTTRPPFIGSHSGAESPIRDRWPLGGAPRPRSRPRIAAALQRVARRGERHPRTSLPRSAMGCAPKKAAAVTRAASWRGPELLAGRHDRSRRVPPEDSRRSCTLPLLRPEEAGARRWASNRRGGFVSFGGWPPAPSSSRAITCLFRPILGPYLPARELSARTNPILSPRMGMLIEFGPA